jgi:hypothetical protein
MPEPKTIADQLDAAQNGQQFGQVINNLFKVLEQARDHEDI